MSDAGVGGLLQGVKVVDLTQNLAGPFCTQILADLGADVIKVEPPGGDAARVWGPPLWGGVSPLFLVGNRGKRSVVLDLKGEHGAAALRRLIDGVDVFVHSARAGAIERLGFDYEAVRALNPRVVYAEVTAFGRQGPLAHLPGYDPMVQAYSGLMSVTGQPEGPPARAGTSVIDFATGQWGALGILAAIMQRERTGEGSRVTLALLDTALSLMAFHLGGYFATGEAPGRWGSGIGMIAPYEAFPTRDGHVLIAAGNDATFRRLCQALGAEGWAADPRFLDNPSRVGHRAELSRAVAEVTRDLDSADLLARLASHAVPSAPILTVDQVAAEEQVAASGMVRDVEHSDIDGYRDVALPVRWDGERIPPKGPPPACGQDTAAVLAEFGFSEAAIHDVQREADRS